MRKPVVLRLAALDSSPENERLNRDGEQTVHKEGGAKVRQADDGSGEEIDFASRTDSMLFTNFAYPTLSQKTLAIIRTARAPPARGCSTRLNTRLWRIATTARTCLIFRSGWGRQRRFWSETSFIRATRGTSAWGRQPSGFPLAGARDSTWSGSSRRNSHGSCICLFATRTIYRRSGCLTPLRRISAARGARIDRARMEQAPSRPRRRAGCAAVAPQPERIQRSRAILSP